MNSKRTLRTVIRGSGDGIQLLGGMAMEVEVLVGVCGFVVVICDARLVYIYIYIYTYLASQITTTNHILYTHIRYM